ncbi:MAG: hypothetical protein M1281_05155 [Chloroflexi bacterium]|nr:hypothetical protein [Chloroflexota bacterium]
MVLQGITARPARVDFITDCYRIAGTVLITSSGVMGLMNDPTNSLIEIQDAQMASLLDPGQLARTFKSGSLIKSRIIACCMGRREDLGAHSLANRGYTRYSEYALYFNVGRYDVNATIEWTGRVEFAAILAEPTRDFIPAFNAVLTSLSVENMKIECPAILMNRRAFSLMALQDKIEVG